MKNLVALLPLFFAFNILHAQGWERFYPELTGANEEFSLTPAPDGGMLILIDYYWTQPKLVMKTDAAGQVQWIQDQSNFSFGLRPSVRPLSNGHLLFAAFNEGTDQIDLTETDGNLQPIWTSSFAGAFPDNFQRPFLRTTPGGYLIAYQNGGDYSPVRVTKTDLQGQLLWQQEINFDTLGVPMHTLTDLVADEAGNFYLSGRQEAPYYPVLGKFSANGVPFYVNTYPDQESLIGFRTMVLLGDSLLAAASGNNIVILDPENGAELNDFDGGPSILRASLDGQLFALISYPLGNYKLRKMQWDGEVLWEKTIDYPEFLAGGYSLWPMPDGGVAGLCYAENGAYHNPLAFRTDAAGNTFTNQLHGNIFTDLDNDCVFSATVDTVRPNILLSVQKGADVFYTSTDAAGNYAFTLDSGQYLLRLIPPTDLWMACEDSVWVSFSGFFDTTAVNSAIFSPFNCPWPVVDLSAPFLRRCFSNTYTVQYANEGNIVADSAVVTLILDPFLILESASLPYSSLGDNSFSFQVGDIGPLQSGAFSVTVTVDCDAELGQTHCSAAYIEIVNPCPTTGIELPIIDVTAACEGDSVAFTIKNIGGAPMTDPAEFVVIEDLIVMRQGEFQLIAQDDIVVKCPADGSTARMYAGQAPGEPPFFSPTAAVEGCNGPIQPGFWHMFPEIFSQEDSDRDCQANLGAFDPNDKQAVPTGYADEHWIARGVPLDYKIRFQNTGTDTAFTVVVRDTLSPWLDPASVQIGGASHAFTWQMLGNGVLEFRFANILLPDSTTDLAASQGFVQFHLDQQPDLPLETLIENRAAIFFDFNAPVITNTTFHRIGEHFLPSVSSWEPVRPAVLVRVVPNPAASVARLELQGWKASEPLRLQVFDSQGKLVQEMAGDDAVFELQRGQLAAGLYLFQITQNGTLIGRGKLVLN